MNQSTNTLIEGIKKGDRNALARSITLVESTKFEHQLQAEEVLERCMALSGESIRIGITGVPGVGKSTFIESFGNYLIKEQGKKVAVLAVDPSSTKNKGSILGDKTRMTGLSANPNAFIRPSPSSGSLGGVGMATREIIILCEAAGYDVIIVETVGVGQSETEVKELVDFFMLLMLPGAGDELQGIKRGIIELADAIFINKADGDNLTKANQAKLAYTSALHLFPPVDSGWQTKVELCSALQSENLDIAWSVISEFEETMMGNGYFNLSRNEQLNKWFHHAAESGILSSFRSEKEYANVYQQFEEKVMTLKMTPRKASRLFVNSF